MIGEAAECHIIPQFKRLIPKLDQSLIQLDSNLGLIFIVEIGGNIGDSLDITIFDSEGSFIILMRLF